MWNQFKTSQGVLASFDLEKVVALPDGEFAAGYLEGMREYKEKDDWWSSPEKTPHCLDCNKVIPDPEHLRRYYGISLCDVCFPSHMEQDRLKSSSVDHYPLSLNERDRARLAKDYERINKDPLTILTRQYWEKVAKLVF